jgi:hypothetical protein
MLKTETEGDLYKNLPLHVRILCNIIILSIKLMYPALADRSISPVFGLYDASEEEEYDVELEEEEELLQ